MHKDSARQASPAHQFVALDGHIVAHKHDADVVPRGLGLLRSKAKVELVARVVFGDEEDSAMSVSEVSSVWFHHLPKRGIDSVDARQNLGRRRRCKDVSGDGDVEHALADEARMCRFVARAAP